MAERTLSSASSSGVYLIETTGRPKNWRELSLTVSDEHGNDIRHKTQDTRQKRVTSEWVSEEAGEWVSEEVGEWVREGASEGGREEVGEWVTCDE